MLEQWKKEIEDRTKVDPSIFQKIGNENRALSDGHYAVIVDGRRQVIFHRSGEPLKGRLAV